jgi:hypothetical protein
MMFLSYGDFFFLGFVLFFFFLKKKHLHDTKLQALT